MTTRRSSGRCNADNKIRPSSARWLDAYGRNPAPRPDAQRHESTQMPVIGSFVALQHDFAAVFPVCGGKR
jgi:hypothetical protein